MPQTAQAAKKSASSAQSACPKLIKKVPQISQMHTDIDVLKTRNSLAISDISLIFAPCKQ